jgi:hypothetical protein
MAGTIRKRRLENGDRLNGRHSEGFVKLVKAAQGQFWIGYAATSWSFSALAKSIEESEC